MTFSIACHNFYTPKFVCWWLVNAHLTAKLKQWNLADNFYLRRNDEGKTKPNSLNTHSQLRIHQKTYYVMVGRPGNQSRLVGLRISRRLTPLNGGPSTSGLTGSDLLWLVVVTMIKMLKIALKKKEVLHAIVIVCLCYAIASTFVNQLRRFFFYLGKSVPTSVVPIKFENNMPPLRVGN